MDEYTEVFKPEPETPHATHVFYTVTDDDIDQSVIVTTVATIPIYNMFGHVLPVDVGRRLYGQTDDGGAHWSWHAEPAIKAHGRLALSAAIAAHREVT